MEGFGGPATAVREIPLLTTTNLRSKEIVEALHLSVRAVDNHLRRA